MEVFPLVGPVFSLPEAVKLEWRNAPPDYAEPFDAIMKTHHADYAHVRVDIIGSSQAPQVESETPEPPAEQGIDFKTYDSLAILMKDVQIEHKCWISNVCASTSTRSPSFCHSC